MSKYQWIAYFHQNQFGGGMSGDLHRVRSIDEAKSELNRYSRDAYSDDVSATLYAYSDEAWASAEDFRDIGCPFDYPDRVIERGPRGGFKASRT